MGVVVVVVIIIVDKIGRITAVNLPMDVTASKTGDTDKFTERAKIAYVYDEWGNLASLVYPDHTTVEYQYDELDRLTKITDRRGNETSYKYDVSGNLTEVRRPNNTLTVMEYDVMGKITKLENRGEDISHSSFEYEYDLTGNIVSEITIQDDVTHTRTFTYDNRNQLISTTDNNGYYTKYYTYEYDRNGNRIRAIESKGKNVTKDTKYYYDAADKMLKAADTVHWETRTTTYNYDKNGNLVQMNMPFGAVMTYDYNVENRLTAIHDKEHLLMAALYDGNGDRIFTVTNKEDTSGWHDDGNNGQWSTLKPGGDYDDGTWHPDTSSADDGKWKPDVSSTTSSNDGQWKPDVSTSSALTSSNSNAKVSSSTSSYNDGQWRPDSNNNGQWNPSGNDGQWKPDATSSSTSSSNNGQWNPDSGNNGQWKPDVSSNTSSETTSSEVAKDENSGIPDVELAKGDWSNFAYDREMIRDTVLIPNGLNTWNEERYEMTGYINNINTANTQVLMEFHDKGYAGNIYEYGVKRESVSHWQNTNYYAYDGRGSVSDLVDPSGDVQMYHSYEPDGQTTLRFRGYIKNPYRYNAERVDYVPGIADFQYLRARYYAPNLGRFIQQDIVWGTIQTPLSQNLFIYCQNNAVNMIDPSGHLPYVFHVDDEEGGYYSFSAGVETDNFVRSIFGIIPFAGEPIFDWMLELSGVQFIDDNSIADVIEDTIGNTETITSFLAKHADDLPKWLGSATKNASKILGPISNILTAKDIVVSVFDHRQYEIDQVIDQIFALSMTGSTPEMVIKKYVYAYAEISKLIDEGKITYKVSAILRNLESVDWELEDLSYIGDVLDEMEHYREVCHFEEKYGD